MADRQNKVYLAPWPNLIPIRWIITKRLRVPRIIPRINLNEKPQQSWYKFVIQKNIGRWHRPIVRIVRWIVLSILVAIWNRVIYLLTLDHQLQEW